MSDGKITEPWWWPVAAAWSIGKIVMSKPTHQAVATCDPRQAADREGGPSRLICDFRQLPDKEAGG